MKWIALIFLTGFSFSCMADKNYPEISALFSGYIDREKLERRPRGNIYPVSMTRLISDPSYDKKHISVDGILSCSDQRPMLFMNEFAYKVYSITEVIYLPQMADELMAKCSNQAEGEAVGVSGRFVKPNPETEDMSIGRLEWVSRITFSGFSYDKSPIFD